ncbi:MAG: inositol monophosphatase family protein [Deltaproteobacteria bacterium]
MAYLDVAERAAREAGKILRDNLGKVKHIGYKAKNSLVTEVDRLAEGVVIDIIKSNFPAHAIFAEESGRSAKPSDYLWLIDPLDGTTNYAHGYPHFCVSIALEAEGRIILGAVYNPMRDEFFSAELGGGAYLNHSPIQVSATRTIEESMLCTGFVHENDWMVEENLAHFADFIRIAQAVRRDGSAALDLCYVACGRYDGFWELGLSPWDTAAGSLILTEAGGAVSDFTGGGYRVYDPKILASNGRLHGRMIEILAGIAEA